MNAWVAFVIGGAAGFVAGIVMAALLHMAAEDVADDRPRD